MTRVRTKHPTLHVSNSPTPYNMHNNITEEVVVVEEQMISIFLMLFLLSLGIFLAYLLHVAHVKMIHESGALLIVGMCIGAIIEAADDHRLISGIKTITSFNTHLFFILLLPPVIFDSGYNSDRRSFFGNFLPICLIAFLGTVISAIVVAAVMYGAGVAEWCYALTPLESLVYGALISATDTVTVLSVFGSVSVTPFLYSIVFGESALNDAVAIVLFRTFMKIENEIARAGADNMDFWEKASVASVTFSFTFLGSATCGILTGILSALFFKHIPLRRKELQHLELQYTVLFPYMSYFMSEGVLMSGIVSVLFCGFTMAHYTRRNLSQRALRFSTDLFRTLAQLSETFVFIYVGMAIFTGDQAWGEGAFGAISVFAIFLGRLVNVAPLVWISNKCCSLGMQRTISRKEALILWYTGLRGGMAYALSLAAEDELSRKYAGLVMQSATLVFVLLSVFAMGGSLPFLMLYLGLSHDDSHGEVHDKPHEDDEGNTLEIINLEDQPSADAEGLSQNSALRSWFLRTWDYLDREYISPFLARKPQTHEHLTSDVPDRPEISDSDSDDDHADNFTAIKPASEISAKPVHKPMPPSPRTKEDHEQNSAILNRRRSNDAIDGSKAAFPEE